MPGPSIIIKPAKQFTWERWQAGRAERRRLGNVVAPAIIRRAESSSDARLRKAFDGDRGPPFETPPGPAKPL
jgi:hypothetical protein